MSFIETKNTLGYAVCINVNNISYMLEDAKGEYTKVYMMGNDVYIPVRATIESLLYSINTCTKQP